jgi:long-chain acyl-CoA synthetase
MSGFYQRFAAQVDRFGSRPAIQVQRRDSVDCVSYQDLDRLATECATLLSARGICPGDRCAILAENDAHWIAGYLGVLRLGGIAVPLDTAYKPAQVHKLLTDCGARAVLTSPRFLSTAQSALAALGGDGCGLLLHPTEDGDAGDFEVLGRPGNDPSAAPPPHDDPGATDEAAVILYTSGTTSDPKGVILTHGNLLSEVDAVYQIVTIDEHEVVLGVLPLFHALAQMANLLLPLAAGGSVVFLETVNTTELLKALKERGITAFCCVPQFFYLIHERVMEQVQSAGAARRTLFGVMLWTAGVLRERLGINLGPRLFGRVHQVLGSRMQLLVTGGSRFDPRIGRDLYRMGFNILQAYGLTETSGAASVLRPGDKHIGSVGHAFPGVEIKIVPSSAAEEADASALLAAHVQLDASLTIGEIIIKGPVISPGYYNRPDVNKDVFRDGWLYTGDLGYLDDAGRLHVTGRAKEIIVTSSGKNIYPEEIEAHYIQTPFIKELCVMGVSHPDEPAAERLHAVIVPDFELLRERKILNAGEVIRFDIEGLSAQLPGHKRILSYDIVTEDLPRTTTRKLKRFEIARVQRERSALAEDASQAATAPELNADDEAWSRESHVRAALETIRETTQKPGAVGPRANLELDLGLDSMERVELLAQLETQFGVDVETEVAQKLYTVGELVEAVRPGQDRGEASGAGAAAASWSELLSGSPEDEEMLRRILAPSPIFNAISFVAMKTLYAIAWLFLGLRVSGRDNLPTSGPMLISPNHVSFIDGFLLTAALPAPLLRKVFFVGASEYFETPLRAQIARLLHIVPVDPDGNLLRAMRAGAYGLRNGNALVLFPEGERSIDGRLKKFKKGAAILSTSVSAPIVPVALAGLYEFWPRDQGPRWAKLLPFSGLRVTMQFGAPLTAEPTAQGVEPDYTGMTDRLRGAVAGMLPAESSKSDRSPTVQGPKATAHRTKAV